MTQAPMYRVIYDDIVSQITSGALAPADQLPSETDLARQYGVSRMTVRQALDRLGSDQFVRRRQGLGTFVTEEPRRARRLGRLRSFAEELGESAQQVASRIVRCETTTAPVDVARALGGVEGDTVTRLTRVRLVDGAPAALQDAWIPYAVAPSLSREPLLEGSLYRTLTERYGVRLRHADHAMVALALDPERAGLLGLAPGGAVLEGRRSTYDDAGDVVEYTVSVTLPAFPLLLRIDAG